jgi:hypothetical protein
MGLFGSGLSRFWTEFWSSSSDVRTPYVSFYRRPEILVAWRESLVLGPAVIIGLGFVPLLSTFQQLLCEGLAITTHPTNAK